MKTLLDLVNHEEAIRYPHTTALYSVLYNALRRIGPDKFKELHQRNLAGENFDTMVTQLAVDWANDKV
jgi:CRISPR/Cas system endoribonuclease Cas6 (RAMP superfamily)